MIQAISPGPSEARYSLTKSRSREAQLATLSRSIALEESGDALLMRATALILSCVLFTLIVWAAYATVSEIARAPGEIVPLTRTRTIQSMEGGIITDIAAKENTRVKQGDVLLRLKGTGAEEDFAELQANQTALMLKAERIGAFLKRRTPRFDHFSTDKAAIDREQAAFRKMSLNATHKLELIDAKNSLALNAERIRKLKERVDRMTIRAPISGIVKGIVNKPAGTAVRPGEVLCEIFPTGEELGATVRILPKDIGSTQIGQPVRVKVDSYDFARYGTLDGRLTRISADSYTDASGNAYFEGQVSLEQDHLLSGNKKLPLLPGMTVEADIVTGEKTILGYLLKPMRNAFDGALSEK